MLRRLLLAIVLCLPTLSAVTPANAACTVGGSSGFSSGSAVVGNQVVLCANSSGSSASSTSKTSTTKTTVTKKALTVVVVCPTSVSTSAEIVAAALLGCPIPGPSRPPTKTVVVAPKTAVAKTQVISAASDQAAFKPNGVSIVASQLTLQIGESVVLTSDAMVHERSAAILGRIGYVQFVPSAFHWSSDSGWAASAPVVTASFDSAGAKNVRLTVDYQASYRFSLTEPWVLIGLVSAGTQAELNVITAQQAAQTKRAPLLVWSNCVVHPSAYRC